MILENLPIRIGNSRMFFVWVVFSHFYFDFFFPDDRKGLVLCSRYGGEGELGLWYRAATHTHRNAPQNKEKEQSNRVNGQFRDNDTPTHTLLDNQLPPKQYCFSI